MYHLLKSPKIIIYALLTFNIKLYQNNLYTLKQEIKRMQKIVDQTRENHKNRDCTRRGHGVIGAHFAKMTPNFEFLAVLGVIHGPLILNFGNPEQVMN